MVVPAHGFDLDVFSQQVKAHGLGSLDIVDERFVAGGGIQAVGPVALIQQAALKIRFAVEEQALHAAPVRAHLHLAHAEVALHPVLAQSDGQIVEIGVLRTPGAKIRHGDARRLAAGEGHGTAIHGRFALQGLRTANHHLHRRLVKQRHDAQALDIVPGHSLHPHRLPDAALWRIPDPAASGFLLSPAVEARVRIIMYAHHEAVARAERIRRVEHKRVVAPHVPAQQPAVPIHGGLLIDRAEM